LVIMSAEPGFDAVFDGGCPGDFEPDDIDFARMRYLDLFPVDDAHFDPESGHWADRELDRRARRFNPEGDLLSQLGAVAVFLRRWRVKVFMRRWRRNRPAPAPDRDWRFAVAALLALLLALRAARAIAQITAALDRSARSPALGTGDTYVRILLMAPAAPPRSRAPVHAGAAA
jgi:hypothetical protein